MIPCYELRIGNYVVADNQVQRISLINNKVLSTDLPTIGTEENSSGKQTSYNTGTIQPVTLNDEVLKQCGFVYHDYFKFWQLIRQPGELRSEIDIDSDYNIIDFMRKPIVKNVSSLHQLQNIYFMLKGKELEFQHNNEA